MSDRKTIRGFAAGVLVGVVIGSAGIGAAAIGHKGWMRFSEDFRGGYVAGFIEMANLARNLQPGGWVDQRYPYLPQVKWIEWRDTVTQLYVDPENQSYSISSMLQLASHELEKKYGKAGDPQLRVMEKMKTQLSAVVKNRELTAAKNPAAGAAAVAPAPASSPTIVVQPSSPMTRVEIPRVRKWCRCDGKDPKAAQAERQARAKAAEAAEEKEDAQDAKDGEVLTGKKTPPAIVVPKPSSPSPAGKTPPAKSATKTPPAPAN